MKRITLEVLYKKVIDLQRDIALIKKTLVKEPELREDFVLKDAEHRPPKINNHKSNLTLLERS